MSEEILNAIEAANASFVDFRRQNDERLKDIERAQAKVLGRKGNASGADIKTAARISPHVKSLATRLDMDVSELNAALAAPDVKSFDRYLRTGAVESKDMSAGSGSDGGYAVPMVIDSLLESVLLKESPIRQYSSVQQISTPDFHKLVNRRGFVASWVAETAARASTATGQLVDLVPPMGELYSNPQATQQMLDDVFFNAPGWLVSELGVAFAEAESNAFVNGTGVTQPMGILSVPAAATADATRPWGTLQYIPTTNATGFAAVSATASPFDILQQAVFSMRPGYRAEAVFMMHPTTMATLAQVKDTVGRFVLQPSQVLGQPPTIMGYPALEAEHFPAIGANTYPIMFANLRRGYLIVDRIGVRVLQDPFSNKPYVGFYTTKRTGGAILNYECIKLVKCAAA